MTITRRALIQGSTAFALSAMLPVRAAADGHGTSLTADQALAQLIEGNRKFIAGGVPAPLDPAHRGKLVAGQEPFATIVCCSDSRVPPELIFDTGFGELFVVRNAGNTVAAVQSLGSIEYSVANLKVPLIIVLGHSDCGAVKAATGIVQNNARYPGSIGPMVEPILPAALAVRDQPGSPLDNGIAENVHRVTARLRSAEQPILYPPQHAGRLKIWGAVYDIDTGRVRLIDPPTDIVVPATAVTGAMTQH
ncbi:carbonic anhydrase [Sphingomonas sp. RT2P30]|uniref:carbonic anhydrase n=1 Tax=Parasphingomonas halimpatiens TaxID=3096162 RepID=UPI002FCB17C7